jgi:predicted AAA+ superfamily ATPase
MDEFITHLEAETQRRILDLPSVLRPWSQSHDLEKDRGALIAGPRGVGKTTFLLSQAKKHGSSLYLSADHPKANGFPLYDLGKRIFQKGYERFIIDEVHFAKDWSQHIKSLYDDFPKNSLWISDSSSVVLRKSSHDLSRRTPRLIMPLMSFREYLILKTQRDLPSFNVFLGDSLPKNWQDLPSQTLMTEFKTYLKCGTRPFFLEGRYAEKTLGIIEKTIFSDVPFFVENIQSHHLSVMNSVLGFLAMSPIPTLNIDSLAREWAIGKTKIYELLRVMNHLHLINVIRKKHDHSSGKGAKIFLSDPNWYEVLGGNKGSLREAFVTAMFMGANLSIFASENDIHGDLMTPYGLVEVGGMNKKIKASDFVVRDDIWKPTPGGGIPLWMVGCIY